MNQQPKKYALTQLSDEDLERLIHIDFLVGDEEDSDFLFAVLEELEARHPTPCEEANASLARFWEEEARRRAQAQEQNQGQTAPNPRKEKKGRPKRRRWLPVAAAAACVVVFLCAPVVQGSTMAESLVNWQQNTFSFPVTPSGAMADIVADPDYHTAQSAILARTNTPLLPTWYPKGTTVAQVTDASTDNALVYRIDFTRDEQTFSLTLSIYDSKESIPNTVYEKDAGSGRVYYDKQGQPYYILSQQGQPTAIWRKGPAECILTGALTEQEVERILSSIE